MKIRLKVIKNDREYRIALKTITELWDSKPGSEAHDTLEVSALLVDEYERRTFPMEALIPREA